MAATWFVAQTESQRESVAERWLTDQQFETYLPRIKVKRVIRERIVDCLAPLFPSYVFVGAVAYWQPIVRSVAILDVLKVDEAPARLDDAVIESIRARERDGVIALPPRLRRGDRCRVSRGSFFGHFGIYDGARPRQRERALLDLLGRLVRVEFARGTLEPVP